jgi:hypothetical protein
LEEEWKFFWLLISNAETLSELSEIGRTLIKPWPLYLKLTIEGF